MSKLTSLLASQGIGLYKTSTVAILLALIVLVACDQLQTEPAVVQPQKPSLTIAGIDTGIADGFTTDGKQIAEGYGMSYSETVGDEIIPALPVFGFANTQPFDPKTIRVVQRPDCVWQLEIIDQTFHPEQGYLPDRTKRPDTQTIHLELPHEPAAGETLVREMDYGGGYFQIKRTPYATSTLSWNTSLAYKIEIDKWTRFGNESQACYRNFGNAKGRVYTSFKGGWTKDAIINSWASGQFDGYVQVHCPCDEQQ